MGCVRSTLTTNPNIFSFRQKCLIVIIGNHHPSSQMSHFDFGTLPFLTANTKYLCFVTKSSNQLVLCKACFRRWGQIIRRFFQQINFDWCNFYLSSLRSISFMLSILKENHSEKVLSVCDSSVKYSNQALFSLFCYEKLDTIALLSFFFGS